MQHAAWSVSLRALTVAQFPWQRLEELQQERRGRGRAPPQAAAQGAAAALLRRVPHLLRRPAGTAQYPPDRTILVLGGLPYMIIGPVTVTENH